MPDLLACPAPLKRETAETRANGPAVSLARPAKPPAGDVRKVAAEAAPFAPAPAPRRVVFVVRGRPGPTDRPALPPGSPESWGAITDNTVLHHAPYPFPVFPPCR